MPSLPAPAQLVPGADGWVPAALRRPSPNCDARPPGSRVELLVIHSISLPPGLFGTGDIERLFTNELDPAAHDFYATLRQVRVSAHFLVARTGTLTQFVSCLERAWHAGVSSWDGRAACNDFSVGIELEGTEVEPFTDRQYATLGALQRELVAAYPIRWTRGHEEVAPGRKTDPGASFDWRRIARDH